MKTITIIKRLKQHLALKNVKTKFIYPLHTLYSVWWLKVKTILFVSAYSLNHLHYNYNHNSTFSHSNSILKQNCYPLTSMLWNGDIKHNNCILITIMIMICSCVELVNTCKRMLEVDKSQCFMCNAWKMHIV